MYICRYILEMLKKDIKPRDIMTRAAFENAMVIVMATGGSTNAGGCCVGAVSVCRSRDASRCPLRSAVALVAVVARLTCMQYTHAAWTSPGRLAFELVVIPLLPSRPQPPPVLHLIAMARACGLDLTLDDFQRVSDRVPFIADLKPSGKYVMEDVHKVSARS